MAAIAARWVAVLDSLIVSVFVCCCVVCVENYLCDDARRYKDPKRRDNVVMMTMYSFTSSNSTCDENCRFRWCSSATALFFSKCQLLFGGTSHFPGTEAVPVNF
jgi:hypothetical protein